MDDILKIHVHTDTPDAVFSYAARWGRVETSKADDMRAQHRRLAHADPRPVGIVTDTSADLADSVLDRHHIAVVPLQVVFGDETFGDRMLALLDARLTPRPAVVRFGVVHAEAPEMAERVRMALVAAYRPRDCYVSLATGVLGTHAGRGAWAIFYQVEDGTPARLDGAVDVAGAGAGAEGSIRMPEGNGR